MKEPFIVKIYRGGVVSPSSSEFYSCESPRVVDLNHPCNEFEREQHLEFVNKGATHALDMIVNGKLDHTYLFIKDVCFVESPQGDTIFSVNRKK